MAEVVTWGEWFKSPYSNPNGACVQIRVSRTHVQVRDSALPGSPVQTYTRAAWAELTRRVRRA
jgi:Domain of unknown function (DUF397)